jgi:hypothetical protein
VSVRTSGWIVVVEGVARKERWVVQGCRSSMCVARKRKTHGVVHVVSQAVFYSVGHTGVIFDYEMRHQRLLQVVNWAWYSVRAPNAESAASLR